MLIKRATIPKRTRFLFTYNMKATAFFPVFSWKPEPQQRDGIKVKGMKPFLRRKKRAIRCAIVSVYSESSNILQNISIMTHRHWTGKKRQQGRTIKAKKYGSEVSNLPWLRAIFYVVWTPRNPLMGFEFDIYWNRYSLHIFAIKVPSFYKAATTASYQPPSLVRYSVTTPPVLPT